MKKRVLSLLTALVLCMGLTVTALADVEAEQNGQVSGAYTYQVNSDGTATIVSFNKNWTYGNHNKIETLVIPSSLGGHPVTAIAGYAFTYYMPGGTKTIVIPEGVQRIESDAFVSQAAGASNEVTKIEVPSSVTYIGDGAFSNQAALQPVVHSLGKPPYRGLPFVLSDHHEEQLSRKLRRQSVGSLLGMLLAGAAAGWLWLGLLHL